MHAGPRVTEVLRVLSAGAAQGVVEAMRESFRAARGAGIDATFGAVGVLLERLRAGERCDVVILTAAMIADLERSGELAPGTSAPLGCVRTGVAVRAGDPGPRIAERAPPSDRAGRQLGGRNVSESDSEAAGEARQPRPLLRAATEPGRTCTSH